MTADIEGVSCAMMRIPLVCDVAGAAGVDRRGGGRGLAVGTAIGGAVAQREVLVSPRPIATSLPGAVRAVDCRGGEREVRTGDLGPFCEFSTTKPVTGATDCPIAIG